MSQDHILLPKWNQYRMFLSPENESSSTDSRSNHREEIDEISKNTVLCSNNVRRYEIFLVFMQGHLKLLKLPEAFEASDSVVHMGVLQIPFSFYPQLFSSELWKHFFVRTTPYSTRNICLKPIKSLLTTGIYFTEIMGKKERSTLQNML